MTTLHNPRNGSRVYETPPESLICWKSVEDRHIINNIHAHMVNVITSRTYTTSNPLVCKDKTQLKSQTERRRKKRVARQGCQKGDVTGLSRGKGRKSPSLRGKIVFSKEKIGGMAKRGLQSDYLIFFSYFFLPYLIIFSAIFPIYDSRGNGLKRWNDHTSSDDILLSLWHK